MLISITGSITINPPISHDALLHAGGGRLPYYGVALDLTIKNLVAVEIVPRYEGDLLDVSDHDIQLQRIVDDFATVDRIFDGYLQFHGDDHDNVYRWYIRNDKVIRVDPIITWPSLPDINKHTGVCDSNEITTQ